MTGKKTANNLDIRLATQADLPLLTQLLTQFYADCVVQQPQKESFIE